MSSVNTLLSIQLNSREKTNKLFDFLPTICDECYAIARKLSQSIRYD